MRRHAPLLLLLLPFIATACRDTPVDPTMMDQRTNVIMPLAVGNTWIYEHFEYSPTGTVTNTSFDTLSIVDDTTINGKRWFRANTGEHFINRTDGLWMRGCPGGCNGALAVKYPATPGDTYSELPPVTVLTDTVPTQQRVTHHVTTSDSTVNVPAGAYRCYGYDYLLLSPPGARFVQPQVNYYAVNVGRTVVMDVNLGKPTAQLRSVVLH